MRPAGRRDHFPGVSVILIDLSKVTAVLFSESSRRIEKGRASDVKSRLSVKARIDHQCMQVKLSWHRKLVPRLSRTYSDATTDLYGVSNRPHSVLCCQGVARERVDDTPGVSGDSIRAQIGLSDSRRNWVRSEQTEQMPYLVVS